VGDLPPQPCRRRTRLRLLRGGNRDLPATLRLRRAQHRHAAGPIHWNLTDHPTAEWTIQQFRDGLPLDGAYRFLVHDRDAIFAPTVDDALRSMSLEVRKTPVRAPQANAYCERFIGTARRECLDGMISLNERHLGRVLAESISHYNGERPHSALGPGLPDRPVHRTTLTGHRLPQAHRVVARARLGGLHHDYPLDPVAA
jgi:putative transposase